LESQGQSTTQLGDCADMVWFPADAFRTDDAVEKPYGVSKLQAFQ
jgi:hypothetical protein